MIRTLIGAATLGAVVALTPASTHLPAANAAIGCYFETGSPDDHFVARVEGETLFAEVASRNDGELKVVDSDGVTVIDEQVKALEQVTFTGRATGKPLTFSLHGWEMGTLANVTC